MQFELNSAGTVQLQLAAGQVMVAPRLEGLCIEAMSGSIWITFEARGEDHVLKPGERLELGSSGKAVFEALEPTRVALTATQGARGPDALVRSGSNRLIRKLTACFADLPVCTRNWVHTQSAHRLSLETL